MRKNKLMRYSAITIGVILFCFVMTGCRAPDSSKVILSEIAVGFEKGVSQKEAEDILVKYKIKFEKRDDLNMGKHFFYTTGEKFLIKVPKGQEKIWIEKLSKEKAIKEVGIHRDIFERGFID